MIRLVKFLQFFYQILLIFIEMEQPKPSSEIDQYQKLLDVVEAHINQLTQVPLEERLESLSDFELDKFKNYLAFAITTLQLCAARTRGDTLDSQKKKITDNLKIKLSKIDHYIDLAAK